jgi:SpoVK/Ycf46/Vps4 family AAA+-type ATPase
MVLAATNRPWELDEAILRRLPRAFEVGMPDRQQRASILKVILKDEDVAENLDIDRLASLCEGYSGSDLTDLCKQAAYLPIRDLLDEEKLLPEGFITAKVSFQPTVSYLLYHTSSICIVNCADSSHWIACSQNSPRGSLSNQTLKVCWPYHGRQRLLHMSTSIHGGML